MKRLPNLMDVTVNHLMWYQITSIPSFMKPIIKFIKKYKISMESFVLIILSKNTKWIKEQIY